jgi:hypothetical protein
MDWKIEVPAGFYSFAGIVGVAALIAIIVLSVRSWFWPEREPRRKGPKRRRARRQKRR